MTSHRVGRVNEFINRELAGLIQREVRDPRLQEVKVMEVRTTSDLSYAKVYVTLGSTKDTAEAMKALEKAAGYLRSELATKMNTRTVPRLNFVLDESYERASRIEDLLNKAPKGPSDDA